ncbi:hypothetical protein [Sagittula sp. SSi028]|uniref:hypothetical protein n=1 Tax=Sagittula sp. SSi028 TaxID=3400636 RepID=UPI003AF4328B
MPRDKQLDRNQQTPPTDPATACGTGALALAALPVAALIPTGGLEDIISATALIALFLLALRLISLGHRKHVLFDATPHAKAPRLPFKLIGSGLIGLCVMLLAGQNVDSLILPFVFGGCATALAVLAFGADPLRDKPGAQPETVDPKHEAELIIERADHALTRIADRVAILEDAELTRRTEAARRLVMQLMRRFSRDPYSLKRLNRPVEKFIRLLDEESNRICGEVDGTSPAFARKRYIAKLEVMTDSFEASACRTRVRGDKDQFEAEADLLLHRMPDQNAA